MNKQKTIKAIIFDADGQIILGHEFFSDYYLRTYGGNRKAMEDFFKSSFQECVIGKKDLREELEKHKEAIGIEHSIEEYLDLWFNFEKNIDQRVVSLIKRLKEKGIKCYLATNNEKYRVEFFKQELGFGEIFDDIFSSGHLGSKKPEADFFKTILDKIGFSKEEVLFCDDTEKNIQGAEQFGLLTYLHTDFESFQEVVKDIC